MPASLSLWHTKCPNILPSSLASRQSPQLSCQIQRVSLHGPSPLTNNPYPELGPSPSNFSCIGDTVVVDILPSHPKLRTRREPLAQFPIIHPFRSRRKVVLQVSPGHRRRYSRQAVNLSYGPYDSSPTTPPPPNWGRNRKPPSENQQQQRCP